MRSKRINRNIVTLADLAPRRDVKGGSQQRVFGADSTFDNGRDAMPTKKTKDLTPKSPTKVKGGGWTANDSVTLVRAVKPKITKDLPPKNSTTVKGGRISY